MTSLTSENLGRHRIRRRARLDPFERALVWAEIGSVDMTASYLHALCGQRKRGIY